MKIVLEGIEQKYQLKDILKKHYIKFQGFYFFKPLRINIFFENLENNIT
jgi:EAL domain-containing protein (putative c-di-GMP-specific phosphodiesterase class I)